MNSNRYNKLSAFLRERIGRRVEKICVDGGFTCPNRDGALAAGGCSFCGGGRRERTLTDIRKQVLTGLSAPKGGADRFVVYFGEYSNTYGKIPELKARYDAALIDDRIAALAVATRPDCVDEKVAGLLAEYAERYYVWVELGLQTSNDRTADRINRGYMSERFIRAADMLNACGIDVVAHVIFGLPGETDAEMDATIDFVNSSAAKGIKIHSLYMAKDKPMQGFIPQTFEQYTARVVRAITRLRPDLVVHRITGDCPRGNLAAPEWNNRKKLIRNEVERRLLTENLSQGCCYPKK